MGVCIPGRNATSRTHLDPHEIGGNGLSMRVCKAHTGFEPVPTFSASPLPVPGERSGTTAPLNRYCRAVCLLGRHRSNRSRRPPSGPGKLRLRASKEGRDANACGGRPDDESQAHTDRCETAGLLPPTSALRVTSARSGPGATIRTAETATKGSSCIDAAYSDGDSLPLALRKRDSQCGKYVPGTASQPQ